MSSIPTINRTFNKIVNELNQALSSSDVDRKACINRQIIYMEALNDRLVRLIKEHEARRIKKLDKGDN
jgi:hypothetical protein